MKKRLKYILFFCLPILLFAQSDNSAGKFNIARLKYSGGGDWYNDPSMLPNMLKFLRENTLLQTAQDEAKVSLDDDALFSYPVLFITGHGRIFFSDRDVERLRLYLQNGGFLYIDDDYGLNDHIRRELHKVFPDHEFIELPFSHPIFHSHYQFSNGLPKIHEHDGGPPHAFALFVDGRMAVFYTADTNISDGWADPEVHNDPQAVRQLAFQMGTNIFIYAMTQ